MKVLVACSSFRRSVSTNLRPMLLGLEGWMLRRRKNRIRMRNLEEPIFVVGRP